MAREFEAIQKGYGCDRTRDVVSMRDSFLAERKAINHKLKAIIRERKAWYKDTFCNGLAKLTSSDLRKLKTSVEKRGGFFRKLETIDRYFSNLNIYLLFLQQHEILEQISQLESRADLVSEDSTTLVKLVDYSSGED